MDGTNIEATVIAKGAVKRFNKEGLRETWKPLEVVDEAREAMVRMKPGKTGIVIGSGANTEVWRSRGWKMADIDPGWRADYVIDANFLEQVVAPGSLDFVLAENVPFEPGGIGEHVGWGRLLNQANKVLKKGGIVIVNTVNTEGGPEGGTPPRQEYAQMMVEHGFTTTVELDEIYRYSEEGYMEQRVMYYGRKMKDGYDKNRGKK